MPANVSVPQVASFEIASHALNAAVIEYLSAVLDRGGTTAVDMVATNLMTDVCLVLVQQLGPERLLEIFDNIETVVNPSGLPNLIGPSRRKAWPATRRQACRASMSNRSARNRSMLRSTTTNASGVFTTTLASTLAQSETVTEGSVQETI
jgi:hypothetical protein